MARLQYRWSVRSARLQISLACLRVMKPGMGELAIRQMGRQIKACLAYAWLHLPVNAFCRVVVESPDESFLTYGVRQCVYGFS